MKNKKEKEALGIFLKNTEYIELNEKIYKIENKVKSDFYCEKCEYSEKDCSSLCITNIITNEKVDDYLICLLLGAFELTEIKSSKEILIAKLSKDFSKLKIEKEEKNG